MGERGLRVNSLSKSAEARRKSSFAIQRGGGHQKKRGMGATYHEQKGRGRGQKVLPEPSAYRERDHFTEEFIKTGTGNE